MKAFNELIITLSISSGILLLDEYLLLLVHSKYEGLIPISYRAYDTMIELNFSSFNKKNSMDIITVFDSFIHFITYRNPYCFYIIYLKASMNIPINPQLINEIEKHMTTKKEFVEYLQTVNNISSMVYNREI